MTATDSNHDRSEDQTIVFAFDRDWTVDVNPHPNREAVPLGWVRTLAHETDHHVYAIGNQDLAEEAAIPGVVDVVGKHSDDWNHWLGDKRPDGYYERFPERRERLGLIADLHPEASDYVVVDDLDLSDVETWNHYHAWEFVPAVKRGEIHPDLPWVRDPVPDGGEPVAYGGDDGSEDGDPTDDGEDDAPDRAGPIVAQIESPDPSSLAAFLDEHSGVPGYELTVNDAGEWTVESCYDLSVIDATVERPAAKSLVWCTPIRGTEERYYRPIEGIERVTAIGGAPPDLVMSYGETPREKAMALRKLAEKHPYAVQVATLCSLLEGECGAPAWADESDDEDRLLESLRALSLVAEARSADCTPAIPVLESLLARPDLPTPAAGVALRTLRLVAEERPDDVAPMVDAIVPALNSENDIERREATRCLMELAQADPIDVVGVVPQLATVVEQCESARPYAVYALTCVAKEYPDALEPVVETLADVVVDDDEDDGVRLNATSALGRVVDETPSIGVDVVDDVVRLFDSETVKLRNNAVGVVGDVAKVHTDVVEPHVEGLTEILRADDTYTRINASAALGRVAEDFPERVAVATDDLVTLLDDDHEQVRENACWALGHLGGVIADEVGPEVRSKGDHVDDAGDGSDVVTALERRVREDENPDVCQRAEWALARVRPEVGSR